MNILKKECIYLYFDGGSRGNPGPAGCGASIQNKNKEIYKISKYIGDTTNNVAEYNALYYGLEIAVENGLTELIVFGDSLLVINQVNGIWRCKNEKLRIILNKINLLKEKFDSIEFKHIRREKNKRADELANIAMDCH